MPKVKIQTTEAGITVTLKYPEERAGEILRFYGKDADLKESLPEQESIKPDKDYLLERLDREIEGLTILRRNIEHLLGGGE